MHPIWQFIIIITTIGVASIFGGLEIKKYFDVEDEKERTQTLVKGGLYIVGGLIIGIGSFLVFEPQGKTGVEVPKSGAFKKNEEAPSEPSKEELKEE